MNNETLREYIIQEVLKLYYSPSELFSQANIQISKYTPQLYRKLSNAEPIDLKPHASGVFVKIFDLSFLLTAGHIYRDNDTLIPFEEIGILCKNNFIHLTGEIVFTDTRLSEANDKIDIAILKLDQDTILFLTDFYEFLDFSKIEYDHNLVEKPNYILYGYPVNHSKFKTKLKQIQVRPFAFTTYWAGAKKQQRMGYAQHSHIVIDFQKKKIFNQRKKYRQMGPDPYGISGSGLWYIPNVAIKKGEDVPVKLVGIMTEWDKSNSALISSRIHIITETIRLRFSLDIPKSGLTKINISPG